MSVRFELFFGDCVKFMEIMPKGKVDMVITSPPYNVGVDYGDKGYDEDHKPTDIYRAWMDEVNKGLYEVMKVGGRYCLEIGSSGRDFPLEYYWQHSAYTCGFKLYSEIVIPHWKSNPTAWGSYLKADNVFTIPNFHALYVFYKDDRTKRNGETTIVKDEFVEWTRGVWNINYALGKVKEHPATFPVELPTRCMKLFGHQNDLIFDPFMGTGTTGIACVHNEREFIGCEIVEKYFKIAEKRIKQTRSQPRLFSSPLLNVEEKQEELL